MQFTFSKMDDNILCEAKAYNLYTYRYIPISYFCLHSFPYMHRLHTFTKANELQVYVRDEVVPTNITAIPSTKRMEFIGEKRK